MLTDPTRYQTPTNALQTQAANAASALGGQNAGYANANNLAMQAANATPAQAASQGYTASLIDPSSISMAQAAQLGPAAQASLAQAQAAQLGKAQTVNLGGYTAAQAGPVQFSDPVAQAQAQSVLTNFDAYMNPAHQGLVNATLANYDDQAGRSAAQMKANLAKSGAFGGSRAGIAEAQFAADTDRNRALTQGQLENQAFLNAAGLSQYDATNRQNAGLFNAGALNDRTNLGAQLTTQTNLANAGFTNDASRFTADARNTGLLANQQWANDFAKTQAGFNQQTNLANAGWANENNRFNASEQNQNARTQAGLDTNVSMANANSRNQGLFANQSASNQAAQFGAGAANTAALANQNAANQQIQNQLAAAGLLGNNATAQGNSARADAGLQMDIGNSLYAQQQANNMLPIALTQAQNGLLDPALIAAMSGRTITSNGTNTQTQSGGLLGSLLAAGTQLGSAALMASERRVKRDIELIGREPDGLGRYHYRYLSDPDDQPVRTGVMRDEVERLRPWALGPIISGVGTVDYSKLGAL